ncbi:biopolymer transporter ExbD [Sulfurospirillum diekertiae]|uniref:ExbD/TolR family protein n=1 Tax=Sulfurospirillum diekertiae TaxID=1854492 RepID=UPI001427748D|nr:biopolymer transporter ExbD [Sulfurospirillum diekertiae]QIR78378.1 biopolymer transporter ExbD [Sulfurospirillum diekertiae]
MRREPVYESDIAEINMTPFVDIVLVILVIFMVTATFVTQGKIPLNLPQATNAENHKDDQKPITLSLSETGELYYDDEALSLDDLDAKIAQVTGKEPHIVLRSDAKTPFEYVVKVIDICKKHRISTFAIQTTKGGA